MQEIIIEVNVKALNPKAFVVSSQDGATTLFSYGQPVYHVATDGKKYIDAVAWGRSKSTSMHLIAFTGKDKEALTKDVLAGEIELVRLTAPNVAWNPPVKKEEQTA